MGCDWHPLTNTQINQSFQFTHPVWGATGYDVLDSAEIEAFQFTHPVWGATITRATKVETATVSIHAPRVGCDGTG